MTVGIFGGSFNPVHNGHMALARELVRRKIVDEVWLTLSPLNPLKAGCNNLADDSARLSMLKLAVEEESGIKVCDIELGLPRPSYTINTLNTLRQLYPSIQFRLIIGADNKAQFHRWKCHEEIEALFKPIVYPRPGYPINDTTDLPQTDVSSTQIREMIKNGDMVNNMLPPKVLAYIQTHGLYTGADNNNCRKT